MEIAGYLASILIGISLGLVGSGGSILTVPVLIYLFGIEPLSATVYSLFIVGSTSLVGVLARYREGLVNFRIAILFALPSVVTVFITRRFLVPAIPDTVLTVGNLVISKSVFLLLFFSLLMLAASVSMIRGNERIKTSDEKKQSINYLALSLQGAFIGVITGMVGAGGGFLIVPALFIFSNIPIKHAIGTSLLVIMINSFTGFTSSTSLLSLNWTLLLSVTILAVGGIIIGNYFSAKIPSGNLKKGFGWFVLLMGISILFKELLLV
jgi:uncharacterized membrane protein YfcA